MPIDEWLRQTAYRIGEETVRSGVSLSEIRESHALAAWLKMNLGQNYAGLLSGVSQCR